jgi:hypothetical protein
VGAVLFKQADSASGIAKGDQIFAEQAHSHGRAVGLGDFGSEQRRYPVAAHQLAHRLVRTHEGEHVVFFAWQHGLTPFDCWKSLSRF